MCRFIFDHHYLLYVVILLLNTVTCISEGVNIPFVSIYAEFPVAHEDCSQRRLGAQQVSAHFPSKSYPADECCIPESNLS